MTKIRNSGTIVNTDYQFAKLIDGSISGKVVLPSNITKINRLAFASRTNITEVIMNKGLISIGSDAFQDCSSLVKVVLPETLATPSTYWFRNNSMLSYVFFRGDSPIRFNDTNGCFVNCNSMRLFDMRYFNSAKDKARTNTFVSNNAYLYINVPDSLYSQFTDATVCPYWNALSLKHFVHSCDVASFEEIANPIENDYYSLKGDTNYLNPLGEKQIDIRQYVDGQWVEVDIG